MQTKFKTSHFKPKHIPSFPTILKNNNKTMSTSNATLFQPLNHNNILNGVHNALIQNNTWTLVPCPPNINLIGSK